MEYFDNDILGETLNSIYIFYLVGVWYMIQSVQSIMFQRYDCHACFSSYADHIQLPVSPQTAQVLHKIRDDLKVEKGSKWWVAASSGSKVKWFL